MDLEDLLIQSTKVSKFLREVIEETYLVNFIIIFLSLLLYDIINVTRIIALFL